jgi:hypothetical protein
VRITIASQAASTGAGPPSGGTAIDVALDVAAAAGAWLLAGSGGAAAARDGAVVLAVPALGGAAHGPGVSA